MKSWITSANEHPDWSCHNIPFGRFSKKNGNETRTATRLGDTVVDLKALSESGLVKAERHETLQASDLAPFAALPYKQRRDVRLAIQSIFAASSKPDGFPEVALLDIKDVKMHLPMRIGDYTDFCISIEHMKNAGRTVSGNARIPPQMPWVPIGYHGRSSSIVPSGTAFKRPYGQFKPSPDAESPIVAPSRRMDYEVELAFYVSQPTQVGERVRIENAWESIFGAVLMNDWSARDIQGYEMTPLGPFQGKNFCTTVSDWVVTLDALKPFETDLPKRLADEPKFLQHSTNKAHNIDITVEIRNGSNSGFSATKINATEFYWSMPQLLAAQGISGCNVNTGDLVATGTCSGTSDDSLGSLVELSDGGRKPWSNGTLKDRTFLEDGDEVIMTARCSKGDVKIGLGQCSGTILAAEPL